MEYRQLGSSELKVSVVGLGGNVFGPPRLDQEQSVRNVHRGLELGVNFIDTAITYGQGQSEVFIGDAIKDRRQDVIVSTKFDFQRLEKETPGQRIQARCEESLRKLQTDYIDLYQVHFPAPTIPPEEILGPMDDLVRQGKVRYIGQCNYAAWRHCEALNVCRRLGLAELVSAQNHYNLVRRQVELDLLPFCAAYNVGFIAYFPLGGGTLTGKYRPGEPPPPGTRGAAGSAIVKRLRTERNQALAVELERYAQERGHTLGELAIAWLVACPQVSVVITGTSTPEHVQANVASADWRLTPEEKAEVDRIAAWDGSVETIEGQLGSGAG